MAQSGKPSFLPDRFDDVERDLGYVGTHRRQRSSWSVFAPIGIGFGAVLVLVLAGVWFVDRSDDYLTLDVSEVPVITGDAPPEESDEPVVLEPEVPEEVVAVTDPTQIDTEWNDWSPWGGQRPRRQTPIPRMSSKALWRIVMTPIKPSPWELLRSWILTRTPLSKQLHIREHASLLFLEPTTSTPNRPKLSPVLN